MAACRPSARRSPPTSRNERQTPAPVSAILVDVTPHGPWQAMSKTARGFTPPCRLWRTPPAVRVIAIVVLACVASAPPLRSLPERREPIASATSTPLVVSHPQVLVVFSDDPSQTWIRDLTDGFAQASSGAG